MIRKGSLFCFVFIVSLWSRPVQAQNYTFDLGMIRTMREDSTKTRAIISFFDKYYDRTDDSISKGIVFLLDAYYNSLKNYDQMGVILSSVRLGQCYVDIKNYYKAIYFYFTCLKASDDLKNNQYKGKVLLGLGLIYYTQKRWDAALNYFIQTQNEYARSHGPYPTSTPIYLQGMCYSKLGKYQLAGQRFRESLSLGQKEKDSNRIMECIIGLGVASGNLGNRDKAFQYFREAKRYYETSRQTDALGAVHLYTAQLNFDLGKIPEALQEAEFAYALSTSVELQPNAIEIADLLHKIYFKLGNTSRAYYYLSQKVKLKDSLVSADYISQVALASSNYEFEKKEQNYSLMIDHQKRQKEKSIFLSSVLGLFLILTVFGFYIVRKERKKSETLLLNILPANTARELKKHGQAIPKGHPQVTIMFCDVNGFTKISEFLPPEVLVTMLDMYFSQFDEIVTKYNLEKIKTIGDSYMCASGLENDPKSNALNMVNAGKEMLNFVEQQETHFKNLFNTSFHFRMGIHTGPVVSGVVGKKKYAYDIWGDAVNIAARMEEKSEPGRINISSNTYELVKEQIKCTYRGKISAKNKDNLDMYFVDQDAT